MYHSRQLTRKRFAEVPFENFHCTTCVFKRQQTGKQEENPEIKAKCTKHSPLLQFTRAKYPNIYYETKRCAKKNAFRYRRCFV